MTVQNIAVQIAAKKTEMRALKAKLDTAEGVAAFDALDAELRGLEAQLAAEKRLAEIEKSPETRATKITGPDTGKAYRVFAGVESRAEYKGETWRTPDGEAVPVLGKKDRMADFAGKESAADEVGLAGYMRALALGPTSDLERRVLSEATIGAGGAVVPTPIAAGMIDLLRSKTVTIQAGAKTVPMASQALKLARQITDPAGAWRAENAAIVESDPVFDQVTLTAKSWAFRFNVSRELLEDGQNLEATLRNIMASAGAVGLDRAVLIGAGGAVEPLGIRGQANIQNVSMGTNGAALNGWTPMLNAVGALEAANAGNVTAMIAAPRSARSVYGFVDTTGQPLQTPPRLANVPMLVTSSLPINETQGTSTNASSIFMGDFSEVLIGLRTNLTIQVLNESFAENGQIGFIAWMRADVALARPGAIARIAGVTP